MINLLGPINKTSYGYVTLNIAKALSKKIEIHFREIVKPSDCEPRDVEFARNLINNDGWFYQDQPCIRIWHQFDMSSFVGAGERIGFPIFELDRFTPLEKYHLSFCDKLFVCSQWAKDVCKKELINIKAHVVNLGVDTEIFRPKQHQFFDKYVFLTCGKWEIRKGHNKIIEAFNRVFTEQNNVELWMICDNPFLSAEKKQWWLDLVRNSKLANKITIIPKQNTQADIARLMNMSSCGVFPARAEGWNLELMEMMACNKPVIATNYSAHTEYCNEQNSMLINETELEDAYDEPFFKGQGQWLKFTDSLFDQLCDAMRDAYRYGVRENPDGLKTAQKYTWDRTAEQILGAL